jgi:hypothetical protein
MLYYLTEVPHSCAANDVNAMAIEEATKIIRGHDVVEEYLAYGILPLIYNWSHEINGCAVVEADCSAAKSSCDDWLYLKQGLRRWSIELVWISFAMAALIAFLNWPT